MATSNDIKMDDYGTQIKDAFNDALERISKTYGKPYIIDKLNSDTLWKDDKYWVNAFEDGARILKCYWSTISVQNEEDDVF